ncbi:MAG TPA: xanthine dehydrogenase accessory protein XdhC [Burkholderiales bacterium]|nr:xanthine dehydrogenase accessory protein XdhC [Burkholderiales bacterium]
MSAWMKALLRTLESEPALVRVALASVLGSAPREVGASMLVGALRQHGTIGGGNLEFKALEIARAMLHDARAWRVVRFPLGPSLAQCCGGFVELWFERIEAAQHAEFAGLYEAEAEAAQSGAVLATIAVSGARPRHLLLRPELGHDAPLEASVLEMLRSMQAEGMAAGLVSAKGRAVFLERLEAPDTPLYVFGAGHVGRALIPMLAGLPFAVTWIDSRDGMFPNTLPDNATALQTLAPAEEVVHAPAGAAFVVLTHSHALDYDICRAILRHGEFSFAGLIGSHTKAARFAHRFARDGIGEWQRARLVCPIGIAGIASKRPAAVAVSIAAQLLSLRDAHEGQHGALHAGFAEVHGTEKHELP